MLRTTLACTFQHLNFQKCSEHGVFCTFWLRNVLRVPHRRALFSTSQLPKVVRTWCVLYILTCKWASRHNGVHFFISHPARWLRTRRFSEPTFRPSWAPKRWKNTVFRNFSTFSRTCIFFLLTLSLLWSSFFFSSLLWLFPPLLFHLSILSEVWLLNFLRILFNCLFISVHAKTAWPAGFVFSSFLWTSALSPIVLSSGHRRSIQIISDSDSEENLKALIFALPYSPVLYVLWISILPQIWPNS